MGYTKSNYRNTYDLHNLRDFAQDSSYKRPTYKLPFQVSFAILGLTSRGALILSGLTHSIRWRAGGHILEVKRSPDSQRSPHF
jgi:hypothetical protein